VPPAISTLDLLVVLAYLTAAVIVGISVGRGNHNLDDYLLGGRTIPWWALLLSIVAAETSSVTFLSVPGLSFLKDGGDFRFLQLALGYVLGRWLVVMFLLPAYFRGRLLTAYELLQQQFGVGTRRCASALFLGARNLGDALRLYLTAIVLQHTFDLSLTACIVITGIVTTLYTLVGGMRSVVWNDCLQVVVYLVAACASAIVIIRGVPGGVGEIWSYAVEHDKLRMFDFAWRPDDPFTFWAGLVGGTFLTLGTHGTDQMIVQRCLSASSQREAGRALFWSGVLVFLQFAFFLGIGVGLACYFEQHSPGAPIAKGDDAYPVFIAHHLPRGLIGLTLTGVLSAALSSSLNSSAATVIGDFGPLVGIDAASPTRRLAASKVLTVIFGVLQIVIAVVAGRYGLRNAVVQDVLAIAGFVFGILLGVFGLGLLCRRVSSTSAVIGMIAGASILLVVKFGPDVEWVHGQPLFEMRIAWPWFPVIGSLTTLLVGAIAGTIIPAKGPLGEASN
jgi:SSS family transporter